MNPLEVFVPISFSNLEKFSADLNSIKGQLESKLGGGLMKGLGMLGLVTGIGATVTMAISKAMEGEEKLHDMKDTLAATGQEVDGNVAKFKALAGAISQTTTVGKGQVMGLIESGLKMGLNADAAQRLSTTALGLSKRLGIDSAEAMELLARGDDRALLALGRHSKEIQEATTKQGKLDSINRVAAQGMEQLRGGTETTTGKWEKLHQTVGSLYTRFGTMLLPVVSKVVEWLSELFDWINQLIGATNDYGSSCEIFNSVGGYVSAMGDIFSSVCKTIKEYVNGLVFAFNNWDLVVQTVGLNIAMSVVGIGDRIQWFANQSVILFNWACANWKGLIIDYFTAACTIFVNLSSNIKSIWDGLINWFSGKGFTCNWKPLMSGFESAIKEAPKFQSFVHSEVYNGLSKQMDQVTKQWDSRAQKWQESLDKNKKDPKKDKALVDANVGINTSDITTKSKGGGGSFSGLSDAWKKAQEGIMKSSADKQKEQDRKRTREGVERTAKAVEKMAGKPTHATAH